MDSITQILDSMNAFSKTNFKFSKYIELFELLNKIPDAIVDELNDQELISHLDQASSHLNWLVERFDKKINPSLKKEVAKLKTNSSDKTIPYADFKIDKPPVFKKDEPVQLSFDDILRGALEDGRPLSPVKRRSNKPFSFEGTCPYCGAPKEYIYDNNGKGQFACKACHHTFTLKKSLSGENGIYCPYCGSELVLHHDRKGYIVYVCPSKECSFYQQNKALLDKGEADALLTSSGQYKLRYHYREFKFSLDDLKKNHDFLPKAPVSLSRIHYDSKVLGLALTYYVNYGLSSRKTALILKQVHGVKISHQTIKNYANAVSAIVKPLIDRYPYKLTNVLTGDETYIKVRGKNHYVFFWSDPNTKIITSYTIYPKRDTECACISIMDCLKHYIDIPEDLKLITDGNPIFNAAQLFFELHGIHFELNQVIGVKNRDEESKKYRPFKQIEERLNRTYKQNYYGTNGYDKLEGANSYMVLFVTFFNFLREHSALHYQTPVSDDLFDEDMLMQDKWLKLIEYSYQYHQPVNE